MFNDSVTFAFSLTDQVKSFEIELYFKHDIFVDCLFIWKEPEHIFAAASKWNVVLFHSPSVHMLQRHNSNMIGI